ncbi:MAG: branched-chain amino acid ABC transporter permease [Deltaproteobacteria bacterium]|nr:branched-chain amino acid ABC transporter permease [Deltaproteobacteria bacterium]
MRRTGLAAAAGCILLFALGPGWLGSYGAMVAWAVLLNGTLALSFDLLGGYGGALHLGHGAFFGIGVYASALCAAHGLTWWAAFPAAGLAGGLAARLVQPLLAPLRGVSFAMASLALLLSCGLLARNLDFFTGGSAGLSLPPTRGTALPYRWTFLVFACAFWIHDRLPDSRFGRALRAAAADPEAAAASGVTSGMVRGRVLVLGSVLAGLAGGGYPLVMAYVSPQSAFGLEAALAPVVAVLLGGPGTRWGPLLGVLLYTGLQEWLWTRGWQWNLAVLGIALMAAGAFLPRGLAGLFPRR